MSDYLFPSLVGKLDAVGAQQHNSTKVLIWDTNNEYQSTGSLPLNSLLSFQDKDYD